MESKQMTKPLDVLRNVSFGARIAEDEKDELHTYFVETDNWNRLFRGDIDIVYGPKGSGKSALYSLLISKKTELETKKIILIAGENPRGNTVFSNLTLAPPATENEFIGLWKLYILCLIYKMLIESGSRSDEVNQIEHFLQKEGFTGNKLQDLNSIFNWVKRYSSKIGMPKSIQGSVAAEPTTGTPIFSGSILFSDPIDEESESAESISINTLLNLADRVLRQRNLKTWILLDRLDVAFLEDENLEKNALRALFRVYSDLRTFDNIKLKIFLRSDIWKRITDEGFREASHITKTVNITWEKNSLLNLIIRRAVHNTSICTYYQVTKDIAQTTPDVQEAFFYKIFPERVDLGAKSPTTLNWLLSRTQDASKTNTPREIIHLLNCLRETQVQRYEIGEAQPKDPQIFNRSSFKEALKDVSKVRLEQTLYAEYPSQRKFIEKLKGQKTKHSIKSLSHIWEIPVKDAKNQANALSEIGFFVEDKDMYWIPFLYRDALELVQGTA